MKMALHCISIVIIIYLNIIIEYREGQTVLFFLSRYRSSIQMRAKPANVEISACLSWGESRSENGIVIRKYEMYESERSGKGAAR